MTSLPSSTWEKLGPGTAREKSHAPLCPGLLSSAGQQVGSALQAEIQQLKRIDSSLSVE